MQNAVSGSQGTVQDERKVVLRHSDLDPYGHVNSCRYIDLVTSSLDGDGTGRKPTGFHISYRRAIAGAESVRLRTQTSDEKIAFSLFSEDGTMEFTRGGLTFGTTVAIAKSPAEIVGIGTPILYSDTADVRYSDLDPRNELRLSQYADLLMSARLNFLRKRFGVTFKAMEEKGVGVFTSALTLDIHEAIQGTVEIRVDSWIGEVTQDRSVFFIPYEIRSEQGTRLNATGLMTAAVIDLTGAPKRIPAPGWVMDLLVN